MVSSGYELLRSFTVTFHESTVFRNQAVRMAQGFVCCEKDRVCKLQKLGLFLNTIRSAAAPSFVNWKCEFGVKFVVWRTRRRGNILESLDEYFTCTRLRFLRTKLNLVRVKRFTKCQSRGWLRSRMTGTFNKYFCIRTLLSTFNF